MNKTRMKKQMPS